MKGKHMTASDIAQTGLIAALPAAWRPWARLIRLDRPAGWMFLLAPCWMGFALTALVSPAQAHEALWFAMLCLPGAIIMRSAGCIMNDLWDRDIDAGVARTVERPIANGDLTVRQALCALLVCLSLGLVVLLEFNLATIVCGAISLPVIALYPLAKRFVSCPQVVLGFAFSWGVLIASAQIFEGFPPSMILLWLGCGFWVVGYDTVYAFQDIVDDRRLGVKSLALSLGFQHGRAGVAFMFALAFICWGGAYMLVEPVSKSLAATFGVYFVWACLASVALGTALLIKNWDMTTPKDCLRVFKTCPWIGFALALAWSLSAVALQLWT